ncbi:MAG: DUF4129 domain-containing protein [Terriglobales bacterium]
MNLLRICCVAMLSAVAAMAQAAPPTQPPSGLAVASRGQRLELDLSAYSASLEQWMASTADLEAPETAGALRESLPASVSVKTGEAPVEVSTDWLRSAVAEYQREPARRKAIAGDIQQRLAHMRDEARALESSAAPLPDARAKLNEILSRREFRSVRPPNWFDRLREQMTLWLIRLLEKLFGSVPRLPGAGELLVWVVIALALIVLMLWLKRALESAAAREAPVHFEAAAVPTRSSAQWMAAARAAAARGDYREAMHCAYWAAISRVEEAGVVKPDRTRTPREHLRCVPQTFAQRPLVADLTRRFEVIWYGYHTATTADFEQARAQLEQLGCQ